MLVYTIIFFLLLFGIYHFDYRKNSLFEKGYYLLVFIVCTLMMGLRYRVGGDALTYEDEFKYLPQINQFFEYAFSEHNRKNYQPGYLLFVAICKLFSNDYYFYQFIHSVVFNTVFFWFIKKFSPKPFTAIFIAYISIVYFYFGFEIQREMFAICCFLLSYGYFLKNKWVPYYAFCILAFTFHISAVFMFLLPFLKFIVLSRKLIIISIIVSVPILLSKVIFIDFLKLFLFTEALQKKGENYSKVDFSITGIIFFYFVRVIVFVPFLLSYAKNKLDNKSDWLLILILWISILSQLMFGIDRLNNYLYIPLFVFLSSFYFSKQFLFVNQLQRKLINLSSFLFLFSIMWIKFFTANIDGKYFFYKVYFPYESVFDKKVTKERELYIRKMWRNTLK